ncbi:3-hydroxyacyl-CoA dehydrogenase NAD-binding domain-containing protein [Orrella sp. JC864]|uniref:3-hydroxyacyl-CoA dehydrogenase NAD-binding domain-containing protein n=1 Tax=Orrella sp. JC864 TaxID=3120298 RepID=UPI0012BCE568
MTPGTQPTHTLTHWHSQTDEQGIAWLTLDSPGAKVNVLSQAVLQELAQVLDSYERQPPKGLVIRSGKAGSFIVGADIDEFGQLQGPEDARRLVASGWNLFKRLAGVPYPTLALIRGHCLGGGLELALACRWRIAVDEPATRLGLPEVMLGIFPGWGGMRRLPALIGPPAALDLMLTGKTVDARRAKALGLVEHAVPPRVMQATARHMLAQRPARHKPAPHLALLDLWPLKRWVAERARKTVQARDPHGHYPAPRAILDIWSRHGGNALAAPAMIESLVASDTARNLMRVFRLRERLRGERQAQGEPIDHVHVVGAGVMGADIAAWCAFQGLAVTLQDQDPERLAWAMARASQLFARKFKRDARARRAAGDRLVPDPQGWGIARAGLVIEAISENLQAKQALYAQIEPRLSPSALLATNTSSLMLADLASGLARPGRLVGIHFFNPVAQMPLVEVVHDAATDPQAHARAMAFVARIDKLALPVRSAPGFLVNAVLAPYMLEAMRCVDEGLDPATVDAAMVAFGMPMGPLELADTVGLDIVLAAGRQLSGGAQVPGCLQRLTSGGKLGRKSGKGFYIWEDGKPQRGAGHPAPPGLAQRLLAPLIAQTREQVRQGVVADEDLADAGVIFGTGFAPFRGGPLHYARSHG